MTISGQFTLEELDPGVAQQLHARAGQLVELPVGGGSMAGKLDDWGVDQFGPFVVLSGEYWDLGDVRWPWGGSPAASEP